MSKHRDEHRRVERPDVFLSYNRKDVGQARKIKEALEAANFTVWFDKNIQSGRDWREEINHKISRARCVVLYWSKRAEKSWWVAYEAFSAQQLDKLVIASFEDINTASGSWAKDLQCTRLRQPVFKKFTKTEDWDRLCKDIEFKRKRLPRLKFKGWIGGGIVHKGGVTSVAFHPVDETLLLSCGKDGRANLWNAGETVAALKIVQAADQDDYVAEADPAPAHMRFDINTATSNPAWAVNRAGFSTSGDLMFLAGEDGNARIFRGKNFQNLVAALPHTRAAFPGYDGSKLSGLNRFSQGVVDCAIDEQERVLTLGADAVQVWSLQSQDAPGRSMTLPVGARGRSVDCFYSRRARAFYLSDRSGRIFRVDQSDALIQDALPRRRAPGAVLGHSPAVHIDDQDGEVVATCSVSTSDRRIDVHEFRDGEYHRVGHQSLRADYPVRALAVHPDAPVIVAAAGYRPLVMAWDDANRIELATDPGSYSEGGSGDHTAPLQTVAISRSGRFVVGGGEDGCISVWEDETPRG